MQIPTNPVSNVLSTILDGESRAASHSGSNPLFDQLFIAQRLSVIGGQPMEFAEIQAAALVQFSEAQGERPSTETILAEVTEEDIDSVGSRGKPFPLNGNDLPLGLTLRRADKNQEPSANSFDLPMESPGAESDKNVLINAGEAQTDLARFSNSDEVSPSAVEVSPPANEYLPLQPMMSQYETAYRFTEKMRFAHGASDFVRPSERVNSDSSIAGMQSMPESSEKTRASSEVALPRDRAPFDERTSERTSRLTFASLGAEAQRIANRVSGEIGANSENAEKTPLKVIDYERPNKSLPESRGSERASTPSVAPSTLASFSFEEPIDSSPGFQNIVAKEPLDANPVDSRKMLETGIGHRNTLPRTDTEGSESYRDWSFLPQATSSSVDVKPQLNFTLAENAMTDPKWGQTMAARLGWMANNGVHSATVQLHPEELGRINVQISLDGDSGRVQFQAQHAETSELLERMLPRLTHGFEQQGLRLDEVKVSLMNQNTNPSLAQGQGHNSAAGQSGNNSGGRGDQQGSAGANGDGEATHNVVVNRAGGVDDYA